MITETGFMKWFNRDFWRAFETLNIPVTLPKTPPEKKNLLAEVFESITTARYSPGIPEIELVLNKGHGVARIKPIFCIQDYCVYYFCIKELEDVLCVNRTANTFGGWRLGGKLRKQEHEEIESELTEYGRYSFNPKAWTEAFGEFNSLLFAQTHEGKYAHVIQIDLSNFYDSIRLDILERWIREEADCTKGWIITLLFYFLNQWNRRNTGLHPQGVGLPQDALADCSRILANFYLQKYDKFASTLCEQRGALYFRYADDQMILTNDPDRVETLMLLLTRHLDRYGLRVNQKKVCVWISSDLESHRCRNIQTIFAKKGDNQNPERVEAFVRTYLGTPRSVLQKSWNEGLPLLNRLVYSNLESLSKPLLNRLVKRFTNEIYLIRADYKKIVRIEKLARESGKWDVLHTALRSLAERCVHNAFHYELLAFARYSRNETLEIVCVKRLKELEKLMKESEHPQQDLATA